MRAALQLGPLVSHGPLATVHRGMLGGRTVAVKRARADAAGAGAALRREARILGAASHPNLVPVLDVLEDPVAPALVLGWADGGSLADLLADGPVGDDVVVQLVRPVADALEALHRAGVAHLDVSPRNVLLAAAGPLLIDPAPPGAGTPGFGDPAAAAGGPPSARSDVFGLAGCAHLALTGRCPRPGGGVAVGAALPPLVRAVLAAGLHRDPRQRPSTPSELVERLERARRPAPLTAPPRSPPSAADPSGPVPAPSCPPASDPWPPMSPEPSWPPTTGPSPPASPGPPPIRAPVPARSPVTGRPVTRHRSPPSRPPRTWPFDRWQEEAEAAADRAAPPPGTASGTGRGRVRPVHLVAVAAATAAAATALTIAW